MPRYRKLPAEIDAIRWEGNWPAIRTWLAQFGVDRTAMAEDRAPVWRHSLNPDKLRIRTLEGVVTAERGDYLCRDVEGGFYPCRASVFEATYALA